MPSVLDVAGDQNTVTVLESGEETPPSRRRVVQDSPQDKKVHHGVLVSKIPAKIAKKVAAPKKAETSVCWIFIKTLQFLFGITIGLYALFITLWGIFNNYSVSGVHPLLVITGLVALLTILAFCEGTQISLMLLEKVPPSELSKLDKSCSGRVRRTHELAQENAERYLVGRQIFVTGIVFLIAKFIRMNDQFSTAVGTELGFLGNEYLVSIFVDTGLAGSLIVLAFGQLLPQLIVTTTPILQYQLFPTYELVWVACLLERTGIAEMANILRRLTRWAANLVDEPFAVGSGVQYTTGKNDEDAGEAEKSCCTTYWKTWPNWWGAIKSVIGVMVFCGSLFGIVWGITHGWSDFTKWEKGVDGEYILGSDGYYISKPGDVNIWIQLLLFVPLSNIVMGFLEGSQIAILALEKAPGKTIKRVHRQAYFGHKLTQQRDNVRRYLLGRQFLVVFVDFVAAHSMGLMGLGILVPVSQLYPQLLAASNPMWFLGTFGSKFVLLLALMMEFCGFCHFSWTLFIFFFWIRGCLSNGKGEEETFSVGKAVDISGGDGDDLADAIDEADVSELKKVVVEQQQKIEVLEGIIDQDMPDRIGELVAEQLRNYFRLQDYV